jgi:DNA-binding NarL/FixJ family response regulator
MEMARVMLIDDDLFVRTTLTAAMAASGINVVASTDNASDSLKLLAQTDPEVVIVDLDLGPGPSGLDICTGLRAEKPEVGLILLTSYLDPRIHDPSNSQLPRGCRFISKSELTNMKLLIEEILIARVKPLATTPPRKGRKSALTDAQLEVLISVAQGLSSQEIANQRGVSVKAIEGMIAKTQKVLGVTKSKSTNQRVQLTRLYFAMTGKTPPRG